MQERNAAVAKALLLTGLLTLVSNRYLLSLLDDDIRVRSICLRQRSQGYRNCKVE